MLEDFLEGFTARAARELRRGLFATLGEFSQQGRDESLAVFPVDGRREFGEVLEAFLAGFTARGPKGFQIASSAKPSESGIVLISRAPMVAPLAGSMDAAEPLLFGII